MKIDLPADFDALLKMESELSDKILQTENELNEFKKGLMGVREKLNSLMTPLDYWAKFCWDYIHKKGVSKPNALPIIYEMDDFKKTGIKKEDLENAVSSLFEKERQKILRDMKKKLGLK